MQDATPEQPTPPAKPEPTKLPEKLPSPKIAEDAEKVNKAMRLRIAGATWRVIAQELGMTEYGAACLVKRHVNKLRDETAEDAGMLKYFMHERLEAMYAAVLQRSGMGRVQQKRDAAGMLMVDANGQPVMEPVPVDLEAVDRMLKICDAESRLHGLDAPLRVQTLQIAADLRGFGEQVSLILLKHLPEESRPAVMREIRSLITRQSNQIEESGLPR